MPERAVGACRFSSFADAEHAQVVASVSQAVVCFSSRADAEYSVSAYHPNPALSSTRDLVAGLTRILTPVISATS